MERSTAGNFKTLEILKVKERPIPSSQSPLIHSFLGSDPYSLTDMFSGAIPMQIL